MEESMIHLCFIYTSMTDAILPDFSSAAVHYTAIQLTNYWWKGSTSTAIPPASTSNIIGQHNKIGGITFGAPLLLSEQTPSEAHHLIGV
jgi:hypothetical protein